GAVDRERRASVARTVEVGIRDQRGAQARREILVLPIGPGFGPRQVLERADANASQYQHEEDRGPGEPPVCAARSPRWQAGRWPRPRPGRPACLAIVDRHAEPLTVRRSATLMVGSAHARSFRMRARDALSRESIWAVQRPITSARSSRACRLSASPRASPQQGGLPRAPNPNRQAVL